MTKEEIIEVLDLGKFDQIHSPPSSGNGESVIKLDGIHSWDCLILSLKSLNEDHFIKIMKSDIPFGFDNNESNGHYSNGAFWTLKEFISRNGDQELRNRLSLSGLY